MTHVLIGGSAEADETNVEPGQTHDWNEDQNSHKQQKEPSSLRVKESLTIDRLIHVYTCMHVKHIYTVHVC